MLRSVTARLSLFGSRLTSGTCSSPHPMAGKSRLGILAWNVCARIWPSMVLELIHWRVRNEEGGGFWAASCQAQAGEGELFRISPVEFNRPGARAQ